MAKAKRAANGMGCMSYDEKRKLYRYRITAGRDESGKPIRKVFSGKTQDSAMSKFESWKREIKEHEENIHSDITLAEFGKRWYEGYSKKVEESTAEGYKYTLKIINKEIGDMLLVDIKARHIENLLDKLSATYSKSQVGKVRSRLNQILRKAEAEDIISKNPVALAERTSYKRVEFGIEGKDAFTVNELKKLMLHLPHTRTGHSIRLMLGTGIGMGELLALNKDNIAVDGSWIDIIQSVKVGKESRHYVGAVKAENRYRRIIVPQVVRPSVQFLYNKANYYVIEGRRKGFPIYPSTYRNYYKKAVNSVEGVRLLTPHCCRHTYISHLEDNATDFAVIQALSGHSDQASTINYIHPQSEAISKAVEKINDLLDPEKPANNPIGTPIGAPSFGDEKSKTPQTP